MSQNSPSKPLQWRLQSKLDRRFRTGHPWVYSNEIQGSPKGTIPGQKVVLQDAGGKFLGWGYGNPHSLIAFRLLGRNPEELERPTVDWLESQLQEAWEVRQRSRMDQGSFRLCFGEADGLPGLVIDRYELDNEGVQAFAIQPHTAGAEGWMVDLPEALERVVAKKLGPSRWTKTALIERADLPIRKLEGIESRQPRILKDVAGIDWSKATIQLALLQGEAGVLRFEVDLLEGQKTGFFLDQRENTQRFARVLTGAASTSTSVFRILDLCCYVGQWSTTLIAALARGGHAGEVEITLLDASEAALTRAQKNVERIGLKGVRIKRIQGDVFEKLASLPEQGFDVVISDPPALIKGRKDLGPGTHAYLQLNTAALGRVKSGGFLVACSCSALLEEEEFGKTLAKAAGRAKRRVRWLARGGQAADHPVLAEFPEGRYLKTWLAQVTEAR